MFSPAHPHPEPRTKAAGSYLTKENATRWNGRNELGEKVSSGAYFYTIHAGEYKATRKMLMNKSYDTPGSNSMVICVNDEAIIPAMVERGVSLGDAREYTFVGCGQTYPHGRGHGNYEDVVINSAKPLELTLNDGIDPVINQRLGPTTGKPNMLLSYEQFEKAYRQQMENHISERIRAVNDRRSRIKGHAYDFLRSLLTYSCVECGLDWHEGGAE